MKKLAIFPNLCAYALMAYGACLLVICLINIYLMLFPNANIFLVGLLAFLTVLLMGLCIAWYIVSREKESEEDEK